LCAGPAPVNVVPGHHRTASQLRVHGFAMSLRRTGITALLAVALASCAAPRGPRAVESWSAVVTPDSAVFVMPSGWDHVPLPPPAPPGQSRIDYGWAVVIPSDRGLEISAHRFTTDSVGTRGTPLERLMAPSRLCVCEAGPSGGRHAHDTAQPPRVPRQVTARARGNDVVLTLKAAPAVQMAFGARPAQVWIRRYLRWPQGDSVLVPVRYTSPTLPRADPPHAHR